MPINAAESRLASRPCFHSIVDLTLSLDSSEPWANSWDSVGSSFKSASIWARKSLEVRHYKMEPKISCVAIIGCGVIGSSWACLFLSKGLKVVIYDPLAGSKERFQQYLQNTWPVLQANGGLDNSLAENYTFVDDLALALPEVNFVQEVRTSALLQQICVSGLLISILLSERTREKRIQTTAYEDAR